MRFNIGIAAAIAGAALAALAFWGSSAIAQRGNPSGLEVPRFETIGSPYVNVRQGPSIEHAKLWVYDGQRGLPVEVIAETESWRQIRDPENDIGWVHAPLLSRDRGVVVAGGMRSLRQRPDPEAPIVAYLEALVVAELQECTPDWCQVSVDGYTGWVRHDEVWGVYPGEVVR